MTDLPFLGMTIAGDEAWSARLYPKQGLATSLEWCSAVRVVGSELTMHYNPALKPPPKPVEEQLRTASVWGEKRQANIRRLKVGIIGAGSVGIPVAEILARMGVGDLVVLDYDVVKSHNLDRLLFSTSEDAARSRRKIDLVSDNVKRSATSPGFKIQASMASVVEEEGFRLALDCDVLFSCVDRPWPRQVLNHLAYSSLIPVIDGGISLRARRGKNQKRQSRLQSIS